MSAATDPNSSMAGESDNRRPPFLVLNESTESQAAAVVQGLEQAALANEWPEAGEPFPDGDASDGPPFVDLGPYLSGTAEQELPTVAEAWPGRSLFYAGRLNELHSEPGVGKTNVLMTAVIRVINAGGIVLYIDPEDTPRGFTTRMRLLGADPATIASSVFYLHNPEPAHIRAAQAWSREHHPTLVVLDGLAESMAAVRADEDKSGDVLPFLRENLRPFAEAGAAVVISDHVTKSAENRGQFPRGSGAKTGRYDGVSYEVMRGSEYTPMQGGFLKLKIAKDRYGGVGPRGTIIAELHFRPCGAGGTATEFRAPDAPAEGPFRPTVAMERVCEHLATCGRATKSELRSVVGVKAKTTDMAIEILLKDKVIDHEKVGRRDEYFLRQPPQGETLFPPAVVGQGDPSEPLLAA